MRNNKYLFVCFLLNLLVIITSCSISVPESKSSDSMLLESSGYQKNGIQRNSEQISEELYSKEFLEKANKKGLTESQIKTLGNLGYLQKEILSLSDEMIKEIFAPGSNIDGVPAFIPDNGQSNALAKVGIDIKMSAILSNLGYEYKEMLELTPTEIDYIFPNTKLVDKLVDAGFMREDVLNIDALSKTGKENYKEVIKEALQKDISN